MSERECQHNPERDLEYIRKLQRDLKAMTERAELAESLLKYVNAQLENLQQSWDKGQEHAIKLKARIADEQGKVEQMRILACEIAKNTNKQQRIAAGED